MRWPRVLAAALALVLLAAPAGAPALGAAEKWELKVCADPNNLPYSNSRLEGFENKIAQVIAEELGAELSYTWYPQRRGMIRFTLREGLCDVILGVPDQYPLALTTEPYYRSSYVFVTRADRKLAIRSLDDPLLHKLRVGIQIIGDDYTNSPPAHALGRRGISENVRGYPVYGDYSSPAPLSPIIQAVAEGEVDVAIVWGPIAGYFARQQKVPLRLTPVTPEIEPPFYPMVYSISMAVRQGDEALKNDLDDAIANRWGDIQAILEEYGVPLLPIPGAPGPVPEVSLTPPAAPGPPQGAGAPATGAAPPQARAAAPGTAPDTGAAVPAAGGPASTTPASKPAASGKNPYTGKAEAIEEGKQLYLRYGCYGCHGRGAGGGMGPSLIDTEWRYGGDDASVFKSIHDGRPGGMPAWGSRLSEEEIWKIIAFLRSQYKGDPQAANW